MVINIFASADRTDPARDRQVGWTCWSNAGQALKFRLYLNARNNTVNSAPIGMLTKTMQQFRAGVCLIISPINSVSVICLSTMKIPPPERMNNWMRRFRHWANRGIFNQFAIRISFAAIFFWHDLHSLFVSWDIRFFMRDWGLRSNRVIEKWFFGKIFLHNPFIGGSPGLRMRSTWWQTVVGRTIRFTHSSDELFDDSNWANQSSLYPNLSPNPSFSRCSFWFPEFPSSDDLFLIVITRYLKWIAP
jgi:hypothetical protein